MRFSKLVKTAAAGALLVIVGGTVAHAANGQTDPKRYTGCLTSSGTLVNIKAGNSPKKACASGQSQVQLGNGDITAVLTGGALTGGGDQGTITLGLNPNYALPQGCATGQPPKRSATGWYCGNDNGSIVKSVSGIHVDKNQPPYDGNKCVGDLNFNLVTYTPPSVETKANSEKFSLPTGTYLPSVNANTQWYISRTFDMLDGEQFSKGYVRMRLQRTRSGVTETVATWARSESENLEGSGIPWNQDFGAFTALANDSFQVVVDANATYCTRAQLKNAGVDFVRIG